MIGMIYEGRARAERAYCERMTRFVPREEEGEGRARGEASEERERALRQQMAALRVRVEESMTGTRRGEGEVGGRRRGVPQRKQFSRPFIRKVSKEFCSQLIVLVTIAHGVLSLLLLVLSPNDGQRIFFR